jgi:hypothetical protein
MNGKVKAADPHEGARVGMAFERNASLKLIDAAIASNAREPAAVAALEELRAAIVAREESPPAGRPCWHCHAVVADDAAPCPLCGSGPEYREGARLVRDAADLLERANGVLVHLRNWAHKRGLWALQLAGDSARVTHVVVGAAHVRQLRMILDEDAQHATRVQGGNHLAVLKGNA